MIFIDSDVLRNTYWKVCYLLSYLLQFDMQHAITGLYYLRKF